jgi:hypothetical protein
MPHRRPLHRRPYSAYPTGPHHAAAARAPGLRTAVVGGFAAASLQATPSVAHAWDLDPYLSFGTFLTYTFGAEQGLGWGFEARGGGTRETLADQECGVDPQPFFYAGGALRVEWYPSSHTRLLAAGLAGHTFGGDLGGHGELGLGYRFGEDDGLDSVLGVELGASIATLALHYEPLRAQISPAVGVFVPPVTMTTWRSCWVAGRPLRSETGFAKLPIVLRSPCGARAHDPEAPREVARIWGRRAQTEWASIPAFHELSAQLRALNAPEALSARSREAAQDELRHAAMAATQAARFDGGAVEVGHRRLAPRPVLAGAAGLVRTAVESWLDGCLGEGVAAACAAEEARLAACPEIRRTQALIAEDEHRHAELAWDVIAWAIEAGGPDVRRTLRTVAETKRDRAPELADEGASLEPFGVLSSERQHAVARTQEQRSLERLGQLLARA